jgi:Protein of unknown function (DUF3667)
MTRCPNCSADVTGEYCPACGQRRIRPDDLSARRFVRDLAGELSSFRTRFKTWRTLRLLLWPGGLTSEYLAGRRDPYLAPIKVYLVCAAIFFLAAPWAGFNLASLIEHDPSGTLLARVTARMAERGLDRALIEARFDATLAMNYFSDGIAIWVTLLLV